MKGRSYPNNGKDLLHIPTADSGCEFVLFALERVVYHILPTTHLCTLRPLLLEFRGILVMSLILRDGEIRRKYIYLEADMH